MPGAHGKSPQRRTQREQEAGRLLCVKASGSRLRKIFGPYCWLIQMATPFILLSLVDLSLTPLTHVGHVVIS